MYLLGKWYNLSTEYNSEIIIFYSVTQHNIYKKKTIFNPPITNLANNDFSYLHSENDNSIFFICHRVCWKKLISFFMVAQEW